MKKILVATGTSVNKMKFAVETIKNYCANKNVECEVKGVNIYEMKLEDENPDVLVEEENGRLYFLLCCITSRRNGFDTGRRGDCPGA